MNFKKIIAIALAVVGGYYLLKLLWWAFSVTISLVFGILQIVLVLAIAVPLYLFISRKLLK